MQKPLIVARQEFAKSIVETVNTSGLPAFVMKQLLQDVIKQLEILEERQEKEALEFWQESQKQTDDEEKEPIEVDARDDS